VRQGLDAGVRDELPNSPSRRNRFDNSCTWREGERSSSSWLASDTSLIGVTIFCSDRNSFLGNYLLLRRKQDESAVLATRQ
jgi:hypothetical protein